MSQSPPQTLGKYQIIREIARSNDIVYEAYDPVMNRRVAVKELAMPASANESQKQDRIKRFLREAKAAGSLVHPNIVTVYEVSQEGERYYLAMEYLDGHTLRKEMDNEKTIAPKEAVEMIIEVLKGLEFAHSHGVVHRDVKPDNVQILSDGTIKLTDFGIARLTFEPNLTMDGQVFGTPSYMSPEQIHGKEIDARSDLFSVGIVLYEMIAGEKPFSGDNVMAISHSIMNYSPPQPSAANYTLWQVIEKALDKSPVLRQSSAKEMIAELKQALQSFSSVVADPVGSQPWNAAPSMLTNSASVPGGVMPPPVQTPYGQQPYQQQPYGQQPMPYSAGQALSQPYGQQPYQPGAHPPPGQYLNPNAPYHAPVTPYGTPNPYQASQGYTQTPYGGTAYPPAGTGGQVPVYYPPPPRKPIISSEAKAVMGKFVLYFILLGSVVILLLVGMNEITRPNREVPQAGSASTASDVSTATSSAPAPSSVETPVATNRGSGTVPGNPDSQPASGRKDPTPFDFNGTLSEADSFVQKGEQDDLEDRRMASWQNADSRYTAAMTYAPDQKEVVQQRAASAYSEAALRLAQNGRTAAARQALLRAQGLAMGNAPLQKQLQAVIDQLSD